jgi:quercetin dioxygenase-like cupin family protein
VEVQGRRYLLSPLDNIVVPAGRSHYLVVRSDEREDALFHVAMATDHPTQNATPVFYSRRAMPNGEPGPVAGERINWHARTSVYEPAPGARFQDFFNQHLGTSEMSGGYGRFAPGARLPCHLHDFDESITIVEGVAVCIVEGRRYQLSDNMTALCPRGRSHYFVNESDRPMAMIWVYAGALPERIVLHECCCGKCDNSKSFPLE